MAEQYLCAECGAEITREQSAVIDLPEEHVSGRRLCLPCADAQYPNSPYLVERGGEDLRTEPAQARAVLMPPRWKEPRRKAPPDGG